VGCDVLPTAAFTDHVNTSENKLYDQAKGAEARSRSAKVEEDCHDSSTQANKHGSLHNPA
jgi:hypothetical protein